MCSDALYIRHKIKYCLQLTAPIKMVRTLTKINNLNILSKF